MCGQGSARTCADGKGTHATTQQLPALQLHASITVADVAAGCGWVAIAWLCRGHVL